MDKVGGLSEKQRAAFEKVFGVKKDEVAKSEEIVPEIDSTDVIEPANEKETKQSTPVPETAVVSPLEKTGKILRAAGTWLFRLRKVFMAIPVIWGSLWLAAYNLENLPEEVGLNLQSNGTYARMIDRDLSVYGPLAITAACLLLMFCSRRARYPWIISIFTLVLPLLMLITNIYPQ